MFLFHLGDVFSSFWYIIGLFVRPETQSGMYSPSQQLSFSENYA